jgi:hypothetical protein
MKTFYKFALIALAVGAIIFLVVSNDREDRPFDKVEISRNNIVNNGTDKIYYDTIFQLGLNLMGMQGLDILIRPLSDDAKSQFDGELKAHVREMNGFYYIFIDELDRQESIKIIAHEIIHMQQYFSNDLHVVDNNYLLWRGREFEINGLPYDSRPWEKEAFEKGSSLARNIDEVLYKD